MAKIQIDDVADLQEKLEALCKMNMITDEQMQRVDRNMQRLEKMNIAIFGSLGAIIPTIGYILTIVGVL